MKKNYNLKVRINIANQFLIFYKELFLKKKYRN